MNKVDKAVFNMLADFGGSKKVLKENVLDYPKKELCPEVWDKNKKLRPSVKKELMRRFNAWKEKVAPDMKVINWYILGSITTYQYNSTSDIDINLLVDYPREKISKIWTSLPNGNELFGHPVNFYLSPDRRDIDKSKTLYDMEAETWDKEPNKTDTVVPTKYSIEIAKFFMDGIDLRISEYERDKKELELLKDMLKNKDSEVEEDEIKEQIAKKEDEVKADVDSIKLAHYVIKAIRKEAFDDDEGWKFQFSISINQDDDPNKSINNLIYKELEKFGYFKKIEEIEKL